MTLLWRYSQRKTETERADVIFAVHSKTTMKLKLMLMFKPVCPSLGRFGRKQMFPVHLLSHKYANDTWEGRHFLLDSHLKIKIIFLTIELTTPLPSKTIVSQICGWHDISSVHGNKLKRKNCGHFVATLHMYTTCR